MDKLLSNQTQPGKRESRLKQCSGLNSAGNFRTRGSGDDRDWMSVGAIGKGVLDNDRLKKTESLLESIFILASFCRFSDNSWQMSGKPGINCGDNDGC